MYKNITNSLKKSYSNLKEICFIRNIELHSVCRLMIRSYLVLLRTILKNLFCTTEWHPGGEWVLIQPPSLENDLNRKII